jgi:DivIVA domain-containing protein
MTPVFALLAGLIVAGLAIALAGRWRPEGLPASRPELGPARPADRIRFDVVLRGYRMDQVDAELERLRALLERTEAAPEIGPVSTPPPGDG